MNAHQTKFAEAVAQVVMDKENVNLSYAMQNPKLVERELTYEKVMRIHTSRMTHLINNCVVLGRQ